jgi:hypothetical protein
MKKQEIVESSSGSEVSHDEILDSLLDDFDQKKLNKFTTAEQVKLT